MPITQHSCVAFRHVAFEDLGLLEPLLAERGRCCFSEWLSTVVPGTGGVS